MPDPGWVVERIRKAHQRDAFDCGVADMNDFLRRHARQSDELGIASTFVAVPAGAMRVAGYYTVRTGAVRVDKLPPEEVKRLPRYPVPVIHLARLAVDRGAQGRRLGEFLLMDALRRAYAASLEVAAYAIEVYAIDAAARSFYQRYDFREMQDDKLHLYLSMKRVEKLFGGDKD